MDDPDFGQLGLQPSINFISEASALDIYGQQIARLTLFTAEEEQQLGRKVNREISAIIRGICRSSYGLDQLATAIEKYLLSYQTGDGSATKRWNHDVAPAYLGNVSVTLIDTLLVMLFMQEESADRQRIESNLICLLQSLSLGRQHLIEIAETLNEECPALDSHLDNYQKLRAELVEKNLRLVYTVAGRFRSSGVSFDDLIQEGNIGLLKAADRFNFSKGFRFSTYGFLCIHNVLRTSLQKRYHTIARPSYLQEKLSKIKKIRARYIMEHGRKPDLNQLASISGMPVTTLKKITSFPEEPVSLNQGVGYDESPSTLESVIPDENNHTEYLSEQRLRRKLLDRICRQLSEREYLVLKMRFGIDCRTEHTLEEISYQLNVSIERVRQLQKSALSKLQEIHERPFLL